MIYEEFQAAAAAREWAGDAYGAYIQASLVEHIERGIKTLEDTRKLTLSELFIGNDGG